MLLDFAAGYVVKYTDRWGDLVHVCQERQVTTELDAFEVSA